MSSLRAWTGTRRYRHRYPGPSPFRRFMGGTSVSFREVLPVPSQLPQRRCAPIPPSSSSSGHLLSPAPPTYVHTASPVLRGTTILASAIPSASSLTIDLAASLPSPSRLPPPSSRRLKQHLPRSLTHHEATHHHQPSSTCHHLGYHSDAAPSAPAVTPPTTTHDTGHLSRPTPDTQPGLWGVPTTYLRQVLPTIFYLPYTHPYHLLSYQRVPGSCVRLISAAWVCRAHNLGFWCFGIFCPFFGIT